MNSACSPSAPLFRIRALYWICRFWLSSHRQTQRHTDTHTNQWVSPAVMMGIVVQYELAVQPVRTSSLFSQHALRSGDAVARGPGGLSQRLPRRFELGASEVRWFSRSCVRGFHDAACVVLGFRAQRSRAAPWPGVAKYSCVLVVSRCPLTGSGLAWRSRRSVDCSRAVCCVWGKVREKGAKSSAPSKQMEPLL